MPRPKSKIKREKICVNIDTKIMQKVRDLSEKSGININRIIEKALAEFFDKENQG